MVQLDRGRLHVVDCGMTATEQHVFEAAGLGTAPFRYVGFRELRGPIKIMDANGVWQGEECGAPGQPMGTCKYCGQGIAICCEIVSADGKRFVVGSDCVEKTGDAGLRRVKTDVQKFKREATVARENERIDALHIRLQNDSVLGNLLNSKPHPQAWRNEQGETLLDSVIWMLGNAGHAGKIKMVRMIARLEKKG
jgi:hypothetical protein